MSGSPAEISSLFASAVQNFQAGRLSDSENINRQILSVEPRHGDSLHLLGLIVYRQGRIGEALALMERALAIQPNAASVLGNYGQLLFEAGRLSETLSVCARLIAIRPEESQAWVLRGAGLAGLGRTQEALTSFQEAARLKPHSAEILFRRGCVLKVMGRLAEAASDFDAAIGINPKFAEAHLNKGNVLIERRRPDEALACFDTAIDLRPGYALAYNGKGSALLALGKPHAALEYFERAIAARADFAEAHKNRGNALKAMGHGSEALASFDQALGIRPGYAEALCGKGNVFQCLGSFENAIECYADAIAANPEHPDAYAGRAIALSNMGKNDEAIADYTRLNHLRPDCAQFQYDMAVTFLRIGRLDEGWPLFEARKNLANAVGVRDCPQPIWHGQEDIAGKVLLVDAEQGLGDTIQFCRYVGALGRTKARIVLCVQDVLVRLIGAAFPDAMVIGAGRTLPDFDYRVSLLSLPLALKIFDANVCAKVPYLAAEPDLAAIWKNRLSGTQFKIGISWQGNKHSPADPGRSFDLACFRDLSRIAGVRLISLQKNHGSEQLRDLPDGAHIDTLSHPVDAGFDAFVDTAAIMENLDLVITSDTAIAHLAGALGRPVWLALKHWPDWRWFVGRTDSPWYPTMTLFRQRTPGDWTGVFDTIKETLLKVVAER